MPFLLFFQWWYTKGWITAFSRIGQRIQATADDLSLLILFRTLFEPWKQIVSYSGKGSSLEQKFRVWFDNVFARIVGFVIRSATIIFGLIAIGLIAVVGFVLALLWPAVPVLPILFIVLGVAK